MTRKLLTGPCLSLLLLPVVAVACEVDEGMRSRPRVLSFTATPTTVAYGSVVTLSWEVESTRFVAIEAAQDLDPEPGPQNITIGEIVRVVVDNSTDPRGSVVHRPTWDHTVYTLVAYGDAGTPMDRSDPVEVTVMRSTPDSRPAIETFHADRVVVAPGDEVRLHYEVVRADVAEISEGTYGMGVGSWTSVATFEDRVGRYHSGAYVVKPRTSTIYRLEAANVVGEPPNAHRTDQVHAYVRVTVDPAIPMIPRIVSFTITPEEVAEGGEATFTWETEGATSVAIEPRVTGFPSNRLSGSFSFIPRFDPMPVPDKRYWLRALGGGREDEASVTIRVRRPSIVSFTATPDVIAAGGTPVVLAWETADAVGVEIAAAPPDSTLPTTVPPVTGSFTVRPEVSTVYTLTALGAQGSRVPRNVSVTVGSP